MTAASDYVARARKLAPTIAVHADRAEAERRLPAPLTDALHEAGLFRMLLPRSLGGAELDPPTFVQVMEEIARTDASTAWVLGQTAGCSMIAAYLEHDAAARVFGPPRATTPPSGARSVRSTAFRAAVSTRPASPASRSVSPARCSTQSWRSRPTRRRAAPGARCARAR